MMDFLKSTKGRIVIIITSILLITVIILTVVLIGHEETGYRNISVSRIFGTVTVENNGNRYSAYEDMRLEDGYAMNTGVESYARLALDDDKYVKLEQDSRVVFTALGNANNHVTAISLEAGSMNAELVNPLTEEESFVVTTPNAVLAVRGTFFKIAVTYDETGVALTDIYTYGGAVACQRVMPDGTVMEEDLTVHQGYKSRIKMDEVTTVYVEEHIGEDESKDILVPIDVNEISDWDMVEIYNASSNGHSMFIETEELWQKVLDRNIDVAEYYSPYDLKAVQPYIPKEVASDSQTSVPETTYGTSAEPGTSQTLDTADATTTETADATTAETSADVPADTDETLQSDLTTTVPEDTSTDSETTAGSTTDVTTPEATTAAEVTTEAEATAAAETTTSEETTASSDTDVTTPVITSAPVLTTTGTTIATPEVTTPAPAETTAESTPEVTTPEEITTPEETT